MEEKILICEYSGLPSLSSYNLKEKNMENVNSVAYVAKIDEIKEIVGADKIEQARIGGWNCIIQKGEYNVGDLVVVATTDAVIPVNLSDAMEVTNYLRKGQRVRTVKLRGVYSECLIIPFKFARQATGNANTKWEEGDDMMDTLKIFKYEPPVKQITLGSGRKIRYQDNPNFLVYYKFPNQKNVPEMFNEEDYVQITRKIHGTNARYGIVKKIKLSLWDKVKKFFGFADEWIEYDYVYGSHNVEKGSDSQGFYSTDVWREIADKYEIKKKMWEFVKLHTAREIGSGVTLYGEIYGAGIQKGYDYGLEEIKFAGFDVMWDGKYLTTDEAYFTIVGRFHLPNVDILYTGKWSKELQDMFVVNNFIPKTKVPHEGIVVKSISGERSKVSKVINPDYLIYSEKHNVEDSH
jgi:RNA ligase (TIGR02306 family)